MEFYDLRKWNWINLFKIKNIFIFIEKSKTIVKA